MNVVIQYCGAYSMADNYIVQINFDRLLENVNKADKAKVWTLDSIKAWLKEEGFIERSDGWLCEEVSLGLLDKKEILSVKPY